MFAGAIILTLVGGIKQDFRWLLWIAWAFASLSIWVLFWNIPSRLIKHSLQGGAILGAAIFFYLLNNWLVVKPAMAIFMECHLIGLPVTIQPHSTIQIIPLNKKRLQNPNWGFYQIPNGSDKQKPWPDKKALDLSEKLKNPGVFAYSCDVSNHGTENIVYLAVPIDLWFGTGKKVDAVKYRPIVSSLDAGKSFTFYLVNDCPINVAAAWQDIPTKVQLLGESAPHEVTLKRKYKNPAEQLMVFLPSKVQWVREQPCE